MMRPTLLLITLIMVMLNQGCATVRERCQRKADRMELESRDAEKIYVQQCVDEHKANAVAGAAMRRQGR